MKFPTVQSAFRLKSQVELGERIRLGRSHSELRRRGSRRRVKTSSDAGAFGALRVGGRARRTLAGVAAFPIPASGRHRQTWPAKLAPPPANLKLRRALKS